MVEVRVSENMWNHTGGLCGQIDGHASNDLETVHDSVTAFASKWQVNTVSGKQLSPVLIIQTCVHIHTYI